MAKLKRKTYKVFGETANPTGDVTNGAYIGQFGSASAGTFVGTNDVETIQNLPAWSNGWIDACQTNSKFPPLPERTGVDYVQSYGLNYLYQEGIPEYDSQTTYAQGSACKIPSVTPATASVATSSASLTVSVTVSIFAQAVQNVAGKYVFTYDGTNWTYGGSTITDIATSYGLAVTGTPSEDDTITVSFTAQAVALNLYKSLQDNNIGNEPTSSPYWWAGWDFGSSGAGLPIGAVFALTCTDTYVPDGALPCNGNSYSVTQFSDFVTNFLEAGYLKTCTMTVYEQQIATYGTCGMFGYESGGSNFRVPCLKDGTFIQQANSSSALGQSYNAGLPNITGVVQSDYPNQWIGVKNNAFYNYNHSVTGNAGAGTDCLAGFNASLSNPIYGNSDTVQPQAVALRYFVQVANGQINESEMDWSEWASSLANKVDLDAQNLSTTGTSYISGLSAPSSKYIDLTLGSSGSTYTAPANGWYCIQKVSSANNNVLTLYNTITGLKDLVRGYSSGYAQVVSLRVAKDDVIACYYDGTGTTTYFRFIYAEGAQND